MEFEWWEVWKIQSLTVREKMLMFHKGRQKKRKGDVMQTRGVINTPQVMGENAPSSSRQDTHVVRPLDFMIELVLHNSFSWVLFNYMLQFDISL
jgi:hypothetical protein